MIAILAAMEQELQSVLRTMRPVHTSVWNHVRIWEGSLKGIPVLAVKTGVGKIPAAAALQKIAGDYPCKAALYIGLAGTINPLFNIGDILIAEECMQWDVDATFFSFQRGAVPYTGYRIFSADRGLLDAARQYQPEDNWKLHTGRLLTGDTFLADSAKRDFTFLHADLKGDAVDMETAAAAFAAQLLSIPFLAFKVISDKADGETPKRFKQFLRHSSEKLLAVVLGILEKYRDSGS